MNYTNYDDVVNQLRCAGLLFELPLKLATGKSSVRCLVDGMGSEKRGWYRLYEWQMDSGERMLTGSYGIFQGDDAGYRKIELTKRCNDCGHEMSLKEKTCTACGSKAIKSRELTPEQKAAFKARMLEEKKKADAERREEIEFASRWASAVWKSCREAQPGEHEYLVRKQLTGTGGARIFESNDGIMLAGPGDYKDAYKYLATFHGALVIPICDQNGKVFGLQFILSKEKHREIIAKHNNDKFVWPKGCSVTGHYWLIGGIPSRICAITEGFATGMSLFEATGHPVAVAFAANNLGPVAKILKKHYRNRAKLLICADDDWLQKCQECKKYTPVAEILCKHCQKSHGKGNAGVTRSSEAALAVGGAWIKPLFAAPRAEDRKGPTDFNDLAALEGVQVVRAQIEAKLAELSWVTATPSPAVVSPRAGNPPEGGGEKQALKPLISIDEAAERFALIYGVGGKSLFDFQECRMVHKDEMLNITPGRAWEDIKRHPDWRAYRDTEVGFDPDSSQPEIICNLYSGWPTVPKKGRCDAILDLLHHLCSHETTYAKALFDWIIKWIAYPIQNPGAKMQTALIVHGDQGAGKNTFFSKAVRPIYGKYAVEFGQTAMEEKFNGWMSGILFGIGNEVIASREELYHVKGKIKNMITEPSWQIRSMHQDARMERNCCNFTFFSNDLNALHLDTKDRRFCVVWTPPTPQPGDDQYEEFKRMMKAVYDELADAGSAAFHDYLLRVDLSGFSVSTPPPMTEAKESLIYLNLDSKERFFHTFTTEGIGDIPCDPISTEILYDFYRKWCARVGIPRPAPSHTLMPVLYKQSNVKKEQTNVHVGLKKERPTVIYFSGITDPPDGLNKAIWLGKCQEIFQQKVKAWEEG